MKHNKAGREFALVVSTSALWKVLPATGRVGTDLEEILLIVPNAVPALLMCLGVASIGPEPGLVTLLGAVPDLLLHSRHKTDGQAQLVLSSCTMPVGNEKIWQGAKMHVESMEDCIIFTKKAAR